MEESSPAISTRDLSQIKRKVGAGQCCWLGAHLQPKAHLFDEPIVAPPLASLNPCEMFSRPAECAFVLGNASHVALVLFCLSEMLTMCAAHF